MQDQATSAQHGSYLRVTIAVANRHGEIRGDAKLHQGKIYTKVTSARGAVHKANSAAELLRQRVYVY